MLPLQILAPPRGGGGWLRTLQRHSARGKPHQAPPHLHTVTHQGAGTGVATKGHPASRPGRPPRPVSCLLASLLPRPLLLLAVLFAAVPTSPTDVTCPPWARFPIPLTPLPHLSSAFWAPRLTQATCLIPQVWKLRQDFDRLQAAAAEGVGLLGPSIFPLHPADLPPYLCPPPHLPSLPKPYSILYFTTCPLLRLGGRGSHATLMSEGLGLDRASWGAALGTETEEQGVSRAPPMWEARAQILGEEREPLRGAPGCRTRELPFPPGS